MSLWEIVAVVAVATGLVAFAIGMLCYLLPVDGARQKRRRYRDVEDPERLR